VANQQFNFPLLCDTERKMGAAYGAGTSGSAKRMGVIIDPQGNVSHYWPAVKAKDFPEQALAALG
jgi:peroxiredoxin Q/BCP